MKRYSNVKVSDFSSYKNLDYINSIWYAIMKMNVTLLNLLLKDDVNYEDIGKLKFIDKLGYKFKAFKELGDTELYLDLDYCRACNNNKPICKFIGNNSDTHFALYFDIKQGEIKDIYHCNWYGCTPMNPF